MHKDPDACSIKPVKPVLSGDPVKSIAILKDGFHFVGRQAMICGNVFEDLVGGLGKGQLNANNAKEYQ